MKAFWTLRTFGSLAIAAALVGCGGGDSVDTGEVTGKVTMDGKPLEGAILTFIPESGRPSYAETDAEGMYELQYTRGQTGALIGTHTVQISTEKQGDPDSDDPEDQKSRKEEVPAKYNVDSELTVKVDPGSNEHNFELESEGEIVSELGLRGATVETEEGEEESSKIRDRTA